MQESRQLILTCAVGVLLAGATAASAQPPQQPQAPDRPLRVMSYNIKHGQTNAECITPRPEQGQPPNTDCNLDIEASIAVIREYAPDIIGLQEIDRFWARSAYLDEPAVMGAALGYEHSCYAPNLDHAPDGHSPVPHQYGTLILSRFPILECANTLLRRVANEEQRGFTKALINVRGVPLQFYNTHLHTTKAARLLQTADIAAILDAAPEGPKVVVGDFNARGACAPAPLVEELQPIYARLLDTWCTAGLPTTHNPNGFTSPADTDREPTSRIDFVFVSPDDVQAGGTFVPITAVDPADPTAPATRLAADHYPVVADLTLPGANVGVGRPTAPGQSGR